MDIEADTLNFLEMWKNAKPELSNKNSRPIIVTGMGGSGIGGQILSAICDLEGFEWTYQW